MRNKAVKSLIVNVLGLGLLIGSSCLFVNSSTAKTVEAANSIGAYSRNQATYYTSAYSSKVTSSMYGTTLLSTLHELMYESHESYNTYDDLRDYTKYTDYDIDNPDNITLLYSRQSINGTWNSEVWNREHVWCQSHAFYSTQTGAGSDLHHLRPASSNYNSERSNTPYGIVANHNASTKMGDTDCYYIKGDTNGYFEPADYIKGDVARILMYMYMHYSSSVGGTATKSGTLNITDIVHTSAGTDQAAWNLLMDWNESDPVDYQEMIRNNKCAYYLGNFNPFIDHPEFGRMIWDSTNSKKVGLFFTTSYKEVNVNSSYTNAASKFGNVSSSGDVVYSSDNPSIATVNSSGQVTGVANGVARIKARCTINGLSKISYHFVKVGSGYTPKYTLRASGIVYTPTSASTAVASETISGETVTYTNSYGLSQLTDGKSLTLKVINFPRTVSSFIIYMKSNQSSGTGTITAKIGGSTYKTLSGTFQSIYGSYSTSFVPIVLTNNNASVKTGTIELNITCSAKSLFFQKMVIDYSERTIVNATDISVSPSSISLTPGEDNALITSFNPPNTTLQTVSWSSSNTSIATVNKFGLVKAISKGTATITATAGDGSNVTGTCTINVVDEVTGDDTTPRVNSVTVSPTSATLYLNGTYTQQLSATVSVSNGAAQTVTWSSSNTSVATVSSTGLVTGKAAGSATITVQSTVDTTKSADCSITVYATTPTLSSISLSGYTTEYNVGDTFSFDGVCTATFSDSSTSPVTPTSVTSPDMSTAGEKTITVSYTYGGTTKTATYSITVSDSGGGGGTEEGSQRISASTTSTYYQSGDICPTGSTTSATATCDAFDVSWLKNGSSSSIPYTYAEIRVYASHSFTIIPKEGYTITTIVITANSNSYATAVGGSSLNNCTKDVSSSTVTLTPTDGTSPVGFTNTAQSRLNYIVVNYEYESSGSTSPTLTSITLDTTNVQTKFVLNETFAYFGLVVTAHYSDSSSASVTPTNVSSPDMTEIGEKTITVTYGTADATYKITVTYPGSTSTSQMIVNKAASTHYVDGAIYLSGTSTSGSADCDAFTATQTKYAGSYDISYENDEIHIYQNHRFTITPNTGYLITDVVIYSSGTNDATRIGGSGITNCSKTKEDNVVVLTPTNSASAISFSNSSESSIDFIIVNFEEISLTWDSPVIDVYSGSVLTGEDVNAWSVTDGTSTFTYSQLTVKLGGETISIPHTWSADDDGKTLTASVYGVNTSESSPVRVTQSINSVMCASTTVITSNLTFEAACGGTGTANDSKTWTVTSDATESQYDSTKGVHYGTSKAAVEYIQLTSDSFTTGTITQVVVNASGASDVTGNVSVTVGGNAFGTVQAFNSTASNKTFIGNANAGRIVVRIYKSAAATNAIYCKSVSVTYTTQGVSTNIANSTDHIEAQRVAVKYAKAFNAAMATTQGCTTNLSNAWSTCSSAYSTFLTEAAALGTTEETYAKNLIKYATAQYTDDSGEACIERMLKTYEVCVNKHGQTAFMSELVSLSNQGIMPIFNSAQRSKSIVAIIIISLISIGSIGGYFFLRLRRKEDF